MHHYKGVTIREVPSVHVYTFIHVHVHVSPVLFPGTHIRSGNETETDSMIGIHVYTPLS